jgi:hypothetical protein
MLKSRQTASSPKYLGLPAIIIINKGTTVLIRKRFQPKLGGRGGRVVGGII